MSDSGLNHIPDPANIPDPAAVPDPAAIPDPAVAASEDATIDVSVLADLPEGDGVVPPAPLGGSHFSDAGDASQKEKPHRRHLALKIAGAVVGGVPAKIIKHIAKKEE